MTVAEFLAARLSDDEVTANVAAEGYMLPWRVIPEPDPYGGYPGEVADADGKVVTDANEADAAHIARQDPGRVLRQVTAMRAILAEYEASLKQPDSPYVRLALHRAVSALAAMYSDHPDYDEEWKPCACRGRR